MGIECALLSNSKIVPFCQVGDRFEGLSEIEDRVAFSPCPDDWITFPTETMAKAGVSLRPMPKLDFLKVGDLARLVQSYVWVVQQSKQLFCRWAQKPALPNPSWTAVLENARQFATREAALKWRNQFTPSAHVVTLEQAFAGYGIDDIWVDEYTPPMTARCKAAQAGVEAMAAVVKENPNPGYHKRVIEKGTYGEISKIQEELNELVDAAEQHNRLMVLQELSDLVGAIQGYLTKTFNGEFSLNDLVVQSLATERAFKVGDRK